MTSENRSPLEHLGAFVSLLARFSRVLATVVETRAQQFIAFERMEIRRAARVIALSLAAALLACSAAVFAVLAILSALGPEHRTLGAAVSAACLALLALLAALLARSPR